MTDRINKSGRASRDKGKRWERAIAARLRALFPDASREGWKQARGGDQVSDVVAGPFGIEAKHRKSHAPWEAMAQAAGDARPKGLVPVVFLKRKPREPALVVMELADWEKLVERAYGDAGLGDEQPGLLPEGGGREDPPD